MIPVMTEQNPNLDKDFISFPNNSNFRTIRTFHVSKNVFIVYSPVFINVEINGYGHYKVPIYDNWKKLIFQSYFFNRYCSGAMSFT